MGTICRVAAALLVATLAGPTGLAAQTAPPPAPVETSPVPAPAAPPAATLTQPPAPGAAVPGPTMAPSIAAGRPTLIPEAGDTSNVDEVVLPAKPVLLVSGQGTWEEGYAKIRAAFASVEAEIGRLGLIPAGRPLALFTQTTDVGFQYEAMVPVVAPPAGPGAALPAGMRFGQTPSGKAWRFVHKGAYDDIDTTYETVTTYLDAKDIVARDAFIEEFVAPGQDAADANGEVNIFVQPK